MLWYQILFEFFEYSNFWEVLLKSILFEISFHKLQTFHLIGWWFLLHQNFCTLLVESSGEMLWEITLIFSNNALLILCTFFFYNWFVFRVFGTIHSFKHITFSYQISLVYIKKLIKIKSINYIYIYIYICTLSIYIYTHCQFIHQ